MLNYTYPCAVFGYPEKQFGQHEMTSPAKPPDEFDALRILVETLKPFPKQDQQRILRWVQEKLDIPDSATQKMTTPSVHGSQPTITAAPSQVRHGHGASDIKSFIDAKNPKSDNQFAAAVAYFYSFQAPEGQRKDSITKEDLTQACRLVHRKRPKYAAQVLVNAHHQGLLDKGNEPGQYRINSVGENLVAMVLPGQDGGTSKRPAKKASKKAKHSGK